MKLYLSSYRIGDQKHRLRELAGGNRSAVVIANAMDHVDGLQRPEFAKREIDALEREGFEATELDLRDYFDAPADLAARLRGVGLIWARGGNTFILRRAMAASGLDDWLRAHVDDDGLVYGGYSAGICVLSASLRGIDLVDPPNLVPDGYPTDVPWDGVGLIGYSLAPHYKSNHPESEMIDDVVAYYEEHSVPYRTLRDGEVLILE